MSAQSSLQTPSKAVSTSPWWLTYCSENKDVFIWKYGQRLKLTDGNSAGKTKSVEVADAASGTLLFKGDNKTASSLWKMRCLLGKFEGDRNDFTKQLSMNSDDPFAFCDELERATGGIVKHETRQTSPELFSDPAKSTPGKPAVPAEQQGSKGPAATKGKSRKRKAAPQQDQGPSKRQKNELPVAVNNAEVQKHYIGTYTINVENLRDPPDSLRVREVKEWYVKLLMQMLRDEGEDYEELTAPLLVICSVSKEDFKLNATHTYAYQVVGGIQRFTAISRLNDEEGSTRKITTRRCAIYGKGLSPEGILALAQHHNQYNQIQRSTTFPEIAAVCRRLAFKHFAEGELDDGTYDPPVPRYNTGRYQKWKKECMQVCRPSEDSEVSQSQVSHAIQMALLPSYIYHKMQEVFAKFEEGKLKGQKERKMSRGHIKKALDGEFSGKLYHFKPFQGLKDDEKVKLLDSLLDNTISMEEAAASAKEMKEMSVVKEAFVKEIGVQTWEQAVASVPKYTAQLKRFKNCKGEGAPFKAFCQKAKLSTSISKDEGVQEVEDEVLMVKNTRIIVKEVSVPAMEHMNSFKAPLVVISAKGLSDPELAHILTCLASLNRQPHTTAIQGDFKPSQLEGLCTLAEEAGGGLARPFTVCTTQSGWQEDAEGDIGHAHFIVMVYSRRTLPPGHIMSKANAICCSPLVELTQCSSEPLTWMQVLIRELGVKSGCVLDVYSEFGELAQTAASLKLGCTILQPTHERVEAVCELLGNCYLSDDDDLSEMTHKELEPQVAEAHVRTQEPQATKEAEPHMPESQKTLKQHPAQERASSSYQTRSKGGKISWSKEMSADAPLERQ